MTTTVFVKILKALEKHGPLTALAVSKKARVSRAVAYSRIRHLAATRAVVGGEYIRQGTRGALAEVFGLTAQGRRTLAWGA